MWGRGEGWALLSVPVKAFMVGKQSRNSGCSSEDSSVPCEGSFPGESSNGVEWPSAKILQMDHEQYESE